MVVDGTVHKLLIDKAGAEDAGEYRAVYEKLETKAKLTIAGKLSISFLHVPIKYKYGIICQYFILLIYFLNHWMAFDLLFKCHLPLATTPMRIGLS